VTELGQVEVNGGQRRAATLCHDLPVVNADDADLLRHQPASLSQGIRDTPCDLVATAEDAIQLRARAPHDRRPVAPPPLPPPPIQGLARAGPTPRRGERGDGAGRTVAGG